MMSPHFTKDLSWDHSYQKKTNLKFVVITANNSHKKMNAVKILKNLSLLTYDEIDQVLAVIDFAKVHDHKIRA